MVVVSSGFDDMRSIHLRFLEEASRLGNVHVLLWSDDAVRSATGADPKFSQAERLYFLESVRYVSRVTLVDETGDDLPEIEGLQPDIWVVDEASDTDGKRAFCAERKIDYHVLLGDDLTGFPELQIDEGESPRKKVIVTGCFDWFHSGHVRFFEEVSEFGDLYVCVGKDANVRFLKGEGHPMFPEDERRYVAQSIRFVKQALVASGDGWLDAEPEIKRLKMDVYVVNEDGDKPEKRAYCEQNGLEYVVLKRTPKAGLPRRTSTNLRGF